MHVVLTTYGSRGEAKANGFGGQITELPRYRGLLDRVVAAGIGPIHRAPRLPFGEVYLDFSHLADPPMWAPHLPQPRLERMPDEPDLTLHTDQGTASVAELMRTARPILLDLADRPDLLEAARQRQDRIEIHTAKKRSPSSRRPADPPGRSRRVGRNHRRTHRHRPAGTVRSAVRLVRSAYCDVARRPRGFRTWRVSSR
jgi:hypothetical protein